MVLLPARVKFLKKGKDERRCFEKNLFVNHFSAKRFFLFQNKVRKDAK